MIYEFAQVFASGRWLIGGKYLKPLIDQAMHATPEAVQAAVVAYGDRPKGPTMVGDVAVIKVCGPITYKPSWFSMYFGGATIVEMRDQLRTALTDPACKAIVFAIDSPGGVVDMVPEFADELYAAQGTKPIWAVADTMVCSAAYWIAAQCDQIVAVRAATRPSPQWSSSQLGSIGVWTEHDDISAYLERVGIKVTLISFGEHKVDGNPYEPLDEAVKADIQADVDEIGAEFIASVARGRRVSKKVVLDTYGQGRVFQGVTAVKLGLADRLMALEDVFARAPKARPGRDASTIKASADDDEDPIAPDEDGNCPDGYERGEDGQCYMEPAARASTAHAEQFAADADVLENDALTGAV